MGDRAQAEPAKMGRGEGRRGGIEGSRGGGGEGGEGLTSLNGYQSPVTKKMQNR